MISDRRAAQCFRRTKRENKKWEKEKNVKRENIESRREMVLRMLALLEFVGCETKGLQCSTEQMDYSGPSDGLSLT